MIKKYKIRAYIFLAIFLILVIGFGLLLVTKLRVYKENI